MKKILFTAFPVILLSPVLYGLVNLGEGQVNFNIDVSAVHDSSIRSNAGAEDDIVLTTRPSLRYTRPSKDFSLSASIGLQNTTYLDFSEYDKTNVFFDLDISPRLERETSRFEFTGNILLGTDTRADEEVGDIITTTNYGGSAQLVYRPNRRYTATGSASYRMSDPDGEQYFERESTNLSGTVGMVLNKGMYVNGRIGYTDSSSGSNGLNSEVLSYSAGLSGDLMPKVSGSIFAGIQDRNYSGFSGQSSPYFSASIDWQASETSSFSLSSSNTLGTTFSNRASETFSIRLQARRTLSRALSASAYIGYRDSKYEDLQAGSTRSDDGYDLGANLEYRLVRYGSVGLTANYSDRSSNNGLFNYDRTRFGVFFRGSW